MDQYLVLDGIGLTYLANRNQGSLPSPSLLSLSSIAAPMMCQ